MSDTIYNVVDVVGTSETSIAKTVETATAKASDTLRHLAGFEVVQIHANFDRGKVRGPQVALNVGFELEQRSRGLRGEAGRWGEPIGQAQIA